MKSYITGIVTAGALSLVLTLTACGGNGSDNNPKSDAHTASSDSTLQVLIGSSGDAETQAVQQALDSWSKKSGVPTKLIVATDLAQQLSQGFAGGDPADLFYMSTDQLNTFAANGSVIPYADSLPNKDDFYPALVEAFSVDGKFYCAPKDFSTLALVINNRLWSEAGLSDADYPKTWEDLEHVAQTLTKNGVVGLTFGPELQRVGVFFPQAGGSFMSDDSTTATINTKENVQAMNYIKKNIAAGTFAFSSDLGTGWGGEAFGKELAAMTIEGNWITGGLAADYPDIDYTIVELPAGPKGRGTIQYTNCWGIPADSGNNAHAQSLVEYLTSADQQMAFAKAFGVMPSIKSVENDWVKAFPQMSAFIHGADYTVNLPAMPGSSDVIADFNSQLATLRSSDPQAMLDSINTSLQSAIDAAK